MNCDTCSPNLCVCVCHSDVFKMDPDFLENEEKYKTIKRGENTHKHPILTVPTAVTAFNQSNLTS